MKFRLVSYIYDPCIKIIPPKTFKTQIHMPGKTAVPGEKSINLTSPPKKNTFAVALKKVLGFPMFFKLSNDKKPRYLLYMGDCCTTQLYRDDNKPL